MGSSIKFVQIAVTMNDELTQLFALDEDGVIWFKSGNKDSLWNRVDSPQIAKKRL